MTVEAAQNPRMRRDVPVQTAMADFGLRPRRRLGPVIFWLVLVALICGAAAFVYYRHAHAAPSVDYETTAVDKGTIVAKVTATGNLSALLTVQVGAQVSGRVQELDVDYNSPVKKGQTIAKLEPLLFQAAVEQAKAVDLGAKSTLEKDQATDANMKVSFERAQKLRNAQVISQSDYDNAKANYDAADAQVAADQSSIESAEAALHQAELNLSYTTIVSPIDGIVISRNVDVGQTVASSFQAPTLFVIANDLQHMQVDTNVGESDVGRLKAGMPATFTVDAYPGKPFSGKLRQVRNASQTVQNVVTYDAVIDVENPQLLLKPGMTANVSFTVEQKDNVVRIRDSALRFAPDPRLLALLGAAVPPATGAVPEPNHKFVWIVRDGKPVRLPVTTGVTDGTWTELVGGDIHPGDNLVTDMAVRPKSGIF